MPRYNTAIKSLSDIITIFLKKIIKFLINVVPSKKIRHRLRESYRYKYELSAIAKTVIEKKVNFLKNAHKYNAIAIGSSHCESAFNPAVFKTEAFNFGINSSDNYLMYKLYKNFIKQTTIKNIICFYDVFSNGSDITKMSDFKYNFLPLKYILNIDYIEENENLKKLCAFYESKFSQNVNNNYNGYRPNKSGFNENELDKRCADHLKIWSKESQNKWLVKLADECLEDNKNFILILSPAKSCYKNKLPVAGILFENILSEIDFNTKHRYLLDLYSTDEFENDDLWLDMDHLNEKGAEIFTKILNEKLNKIGI